VNVANVAPVVTLSVPGTETDPLLLVSEIEVPAGAGALNATVPLTGLPPVTLALPSEIDFSSGSTESAVLTDPDQSVAASATSVTTLTSEV
jgi:hypothetical protein